MVSAALFVSLALGFSAPGRMPVSRASRASAVTMGPIRFVKRVLGKQKQDFLEATV